MVLPLIIGIIVGIFLLLMIPLVLKVVKIIAVILALVWVYNLLRKKFKIKSISNPEYLVIGIGIFAGILTIGGQFGIFAISGLPLAVQTPIVQASLSPLNLFLGFLVILFALLYIFKLPK